MNSKPTTRIWIDVSLLLKCNPYQPTGIPRTTANLFRSWWSKGYGNLRLCGMSPEAGGYVEVPANEVLARFPLRPKSSPSDEPNRMDVRPALPRSVAGPNRFKSGARWLARQFIPNGPKTLIREVLTRTPLAYRALRRRFNPPSRQAAIAMTPNDIVLSLGGEWMIPDFTDLCNRLRREQKFRAVQLVYDLIPVLRPQYFPGTGSDERDWEKYFESALRRADLVVAISRCVQREIRQYLIDAKIGPRPVEVIRLGESIPKIASSGYPPLAAKLDPAKPFILSVGTLEVRKNHYLLYQAWRRLAEQLGDAVPKLVLVGCKGWLTDDLLHQMRVDPLTRDTIVFIPHCDDSQLRWLYGNCLFTIYPSHFEGWGLPVAESLAYGKHCVCSNASSIMEIAPTLVDSHDPVDLPSCLRLIEKALDPDYRAAKERRIRAEFRQTSWDETADQFAQHIENALGPVFDRGAWAAAKSA